MKYVLIPFFALAMFFLFNSCDEDSFTQVVEIELPEHRKMLSISAHFANTDTLYEMAVGNTVSTLEDPSWSSLQNATVRLLKDGNLMREFGFDSNMDAYQSAQPLSWQADGAVYRLEVSAPGFETVSSEQRILKEIKLTEATYTKDGVLTPDGSRADELVFEFEDPAGEENYYAIRAFYESKYLEDTTYLISYNLYLESFDPLLQENSGAQLLVSDKSFEGKKVSLRSFCYCYFDQSPDLVDPKIVVQLVHLPKDQYLFLKSLYQYENASGNPFAAPVTVHGNIENGVGLFSLETISRYEIDL